jgi:ribose 5-phosphate isomerase B
VAAPTRRIVLASDHAGVEMKRRLLEALGEMGVAAEDLGPETPEPVDYPDFAASRASWCAEPASGWR